MELVDQRCLRFQNDRLTTVHAIVFICNIDVFKQIELHFSLARTKNLENGQEMDGHYITSKAIRICEQVLFLFLVCNKLIVSPHRTQLEPAFHNLILSKLLPIIIFLLHLKKIRKRFPANL